MKSILFIFIICLFLISCSDTLVSTDPEYIIFNKEGQVDSAVVYGCYAFTVRYLIPDSFELYSWNNIKISFHGFSNSNGSSITVFYNTETQHNINVYYIENHTDINKLHSITFPSPKTLTWFEIRLYINPPVCGKGEFKYVSVRDLKITGLK